MMTNYDHEAVQHAHPATDCPCIGCNGMTGWYDPDTGVWVTCLNCPAGKERATKERS